jgi:hypothetical protein
MKRVISIIVVAFMVGAELPALAQQFAAFARCCDSVASCKCTSHGGVCCCRKRQTAGWWSDSHCGGTRDFCRTAVSAILSLPLGRSVAVAVLVPSLDPSVQIFSIGDDRERPRSPPFLS